LGKCMDTLKGVCHNEQATKEYLDLITQIRIQYGEHCKLVLRRANLDKRIELRKQQTQQKNAALKESLKQSAFLEQETIAVARQVENFYRAVNLENPDALLECMDLGNGQKVALGDLLREHMSALSDLIVGVARPGVLSPNIVALSKITKQTKPVPTKKMDEEFTLEHTADFTVLSPSMKVFGPSKSNGLINVKVHNKGDEIVRGSTGRFKVTIDRDEFTMLQANWHGRLGMKGTATTTTVAATSSSSTFEGYIDIFFVEGHLPLSKRCVFCSGAVRPTEMSVFGVTGVSGSCPVICVDHSYHICCAFLVKYSKESRLGHFVCPECSSSS